MTNIVLPGDHLSIIEEYQSGKNTIEYNGNVIATVHGSKEIDEKNRVINVDPTNNRRIYPKRDDEQTYYYIAKDFYDIKKMLKIFKMTKLVT